MCGRFTLRSDSNALAQHFEVEPIVATRDGRPRFNIAPTQRIAVIRLHPETCLRELVQLRWGLVPRWADAKPLPNLFNARAETASSKPAFREAFQARRCLIPTDGFYEWKGEAKMRRPWYVHRRGDGLFAYAGLWEGDTCTVLTSTPIPLLADLHHRMPVMARPGQYAAWLDPAPVPAGERLARLSPPADLDLYPVSPLVNRAGLDLPECVAPAN